MTSVRLPVYIYQSSSSEVGGPQSFMSNLKNYFNKRDVSFTDLNDAKVLFISVSCPLKLLILAKIKGIKIIQRLDGLHYRERNGPLYWWKNKKAFIVYRFFADHVVFQTEYALKQVSLIAGAPKHVSYSIIPNGTNLEVFHPSDRSEKKDDTWKFIVSGSFRHADMIRPIVHALDLLNDKVKFELLVVGPISSALMGYFDRPYVKILGKKTNLELALALRSSDIYLYSALNSVCPNALIEALASGLPTIAFDSGGVKEIMANHSEWLVETPSKVLHNESDFNSISFSKKILTLIEDWSSQKNFAIMNAQSFSLDKMGASYNKLFSELSAK